MIRFLYCLFALSAACTTVVPACAGIEYQLVEGGARDVKSGVATPFAKVGTCDTTGGHGQGSAFTEHGTVTFKESDAKMCGKDHWPAMLIIYTSNPGFTGTDDITVYSGRAPFHYKMIVH